MPLFEQKFLEPGRFHVGNGKFATIDGEFIRKHVGNTAKLLADGNGVPLLLEHEAPGSVLGAPRSKREKAADSIINGVGWLVDVKVNPQGEAFHVLDVPNAKVAEKLRSGEIKFTSPEFRHDAWTDGEGRSYRDFISHVALTHKPRNRHQGGFSELPADSLPALQFSLDDRVETLQMATDDETTAAEKKTIVRALLKDLAYIPSDAEISDDEFDADELVSVLTKLNAIRKRCEEKAKAASPSIAMSAGDDEKDDAASPDKKEPPKKEPPANPDLPDDKAGEAGQQLEALVTLLKDMGLDLPADTTPDTIIRDLLTAVKSSLATKAKAEAAAPKDQDSDAAPVEGRGPQQFSLSDVTNDKFENRLLAKVVRQAYAGTKAKFDGLITANKITPALRDAILKRPNALQFSVEGDELPTFTADTVADLLSAMPAGIALDYQFSTMDKNTLEPAASFVNPPDAENDDVWNMTPEQAQAVVAKIDKKLGRKSA